MGGRMERPKIIPFSRYVQASSAESKRRGSGKILVKYSSETLALAERIAQRNNQQGRTVELYKGDYHGKPSPEAINQATERLNAMGIERIVDSSTIDWEAFEEAVAADNEKIIERNDRQYSKMLYAYYEDNPEMKGKRARPAQVMESYSKREPKQRRHSPKFYNLERPFGIYPVNGKWRVDIWHRGNKSYGGTHADYETAVLVSKSIRQGIIQAEAIR